MPAGPPPARRWQEIWPMLAGLPDDAVEPVRERARARRFQRGEVVFHRDDPADTLHLVESGHFAVEISGPSETALLAVLGRGEAFGELALVTGGSRSATVVALEPSATYAVHRLDFDRLRGRNPSVNDVVAAILAAQVRRLSDHLYEALYVPAPQRIRRRLAALAATFGESPAGDTRIPLRQELIAQLAGTSRQVVNRVLREEQRAGSIELERGGVRVIDAGGLAQRARPDVAPRVSRA